MKIPRLSPPTDLEKNSFTEENFHLIFNDLNGPLNTVQSQNRNFIYQKQNLITDKVIYSFYLNCQNLSNLKIWLGNFFSSTKQIQFSAGQYVDISNDNNMNASVNVEIYSEYTLSFSMPMNMISSNTKDMKYPEVVKVLYERHIPLYIRNKIYIIQQSDHYQLNVSKIE